MSNNTGRTVGVSNLKPWKPGMSGNPHGRPKGTRNWSSIVQALLVDDTLANKIINNKPGWWDTLPNKNLANAIASVMIIKAAHGDVTAAEWVRRTGYGNTTKYSTQSKPVPVFSAKPAIKVISPPS